MTIWATVEPSDAGRRLDAWLADAFEELSRSRAQQLIDGGLVTLGDAGVKKNRPVAAGECYRVELPEPEAAEPLPQDIPLDILYEDGDLLVINKPKGMVVHPAPGHPDGTLVNALLYHCGDGLSGVGGVARPGIVHRLDMDTSGLMLCAKNDRAHRLLSAQLADRSLHRIYEAILRGTPRDPEGTVDAPIGRSPKDRKKMAVTDKGSRRAVTRYRVLETFPGFSRVQCELETGRTHQIRVHMAWIGHPVAGDPLYGGGTPLGLTSQCLHARAISFIHPSTGETMRFESELPPEFTQALQALRALP